MTQVFFIEVKSLTGAQTVCNSCSKIFKLYILKVEVLEVQTPQII